MTLTTYIFGIAAALLVLLVVIDSLRRRRLRERHAIWWLVAGILALIAAVFPATPEWVAYLIGIVEPCRYVRHFVRAWTMARSSLSWI